MQLAFAILIASALLSGCSGGGETCVTDNDCFSGEVCLSGGICGTAVPGDDAGNSNAGTDGGSDNQSTNSGTDAGPNNTNSNNIMTGDAGTTDGGNPDGGPAGECIVDPFDQCVDDEDDDNNSFPGQTVENETKGCQSFGFVPMDVTINGRMCALDPEDMYAITYVECYDDEPGFVVEATLDVKSDCDPDLIHFDVESIGQTCAEPDPEDDQTLRCETLPDGRRRIQILFPGATNAVVGSLRFSIQTPERQDVQFDYDLHLVVREP